MDPRPPHAALRLLAAAGLCLGGSGACAQSLQETLNLVLTGDAKDRGGLVEIVDPASCIVKLRNSRDEFFAVLRFNNVDPRSLAVGGKPGDRHMRFSGPAPIIEVHATDGGLTAASEQVQISVRDPARERRSFEHLYSRFCSGRDSGAGAVGS